MSQGLNDVITESRASADGVFVSITDIVLPKTIPAAIDVDAAPISQGDRQAELLRQVSGYESHGMFLQAAHAAEEAGLLDRAQGNYQAAGHYDDVVRLDQGKTPAEYLAAAGRYHIAEQVAREHGDESSARMYGMLYQQQF